MANSGLLSKYKRWLDENNARTGLPNRIGQMMLGVHLCSFPLIGVNAYHALLQGHSLSYKVPTGALHNGHMVLLPIGAMIASTGTLFVIGILLLALTLLLRSDSQEQ